MSKKSLTVGALLLLLSASFVLAQTFGVRKRAPRPDEFGSVIMDNYPDNKKTNPVVFKHWLHRAKFTCRLCHVDLGFAMVAGETGIREVDNEHGLYCGACHNGSVAFAAVEKTELNEEVQHCDRCHSQGKDVEFKYDFYEFVEGFPKARFGNRVDWIKAEEQGLIELSDYLEGVSLRREPLTAQEERTIQTKVEAMPGIIFSHKLHTVWNGCELCHPQIFPIRAADRAYHMQDNFNGAYCGACHGSVAFTTQDCQLCHSEPVS
jgi:c(7)-type cytochrome triheme protein